MTIAEEDTQVTTFAVLAGKRSHLIICLYLWPSYGVKTTFIALTTQTGTAHFYLLRFAKAAHTIIIYYLLLTNNCLWKDNS